MILVGAIAAASAVAIAILAALALDVPSVPRVMRAWSLWPLVRPRARLAGACVGILQATHAGLRSGLPLIAALRGAVQPYRESEREPFSRLLRALELNADTEEAIRAASLSASDRRVTMALDALALVAREDLPSARAAALVGSVAERLAFEARVREEVDARASGARTQIVILALVVPALSLYLVVTMPGLAATLATTIGTHVLVPLALVLEVAGIVLSRSIVSGLEL